jgi:hypothetical protein
MHLAWFDLNAARLLAIWAIHSTERLECYFANPLLLDSSAQLLASVVSSQLNLVKVWNVLALFHRLQLACNGRCLLEVKFEFFL